MAVELVSGGGLFGGDGLVGHGNDRLRLARHGKRLHDQSVRCRLHNGDLGDRRGDLTGIDRGDEHGLDLLRVAEDRVEARGVNVEGLEAGDLSLQVGGVLQGRIHASGDDCEGGRDRGNLGVELCLSCHDLVDLSVDCAV